jgi:uncharacterized SAM-binding protein YcdF (DUF218 family)
MWFDKLLISLISPLGTALALGLLALLMGALRWRRMAGVLGGLALGWLWLWATPVASHALRAALEARYPPQPLSHWAGQAAQAVVVLGGGVRPAERAGEPPNLNAAADRVWHAARLYHAGVAPLVVASGGSDPSTSATSEATAMAQLLQALGVPHTALRLEERSRNTRQNAQYTAQLLQPLGVQRVVLVTSALHMPRAVPLFEAQGLEVLPAATDHEARQRFNALDWLPDTDALDGSARAMKEWVGRWTGR